MRTTECSTPTRLWRWLDSEDRAHRMESPPNLSAEWTAALERIERHQQSTIYMPTALWVLLDMFDAGQAAGGRVRFVDFEVRFSELMHRVSPSGADRAWEPFFHLARTSQVWDLFLGSEPSDAARLPGGRPKSRGQLLRIADRAQLRTSLLLEAATSEGRQTIRHNLMARLAAIGSAPAWALLEALPNAALRLCSTAEEVAVSLDVFNRDAVRFAERARHCIRTTQYWVWDASADTFGPGKFVGYRQMSFEAYERARAGEVGGARFDGHISQNALRRALAMEFAPSSWQASRLKAWADRLLGPNTLAGVNEDKWQFITLPPRRQFWALLANPATYRIDDAVRELETDTWTVPIGEPAVGDRLAIWRTLGAEGQRGVVALAEVLGAPQMRPENVASAPYWKERHAHTEQRRIVIRYVLPPGAPLWLTKATVPILSSLTVSRGQGSKAYRVDPPDWWRLLDALGGWPEDEDDDERAAAEHQESRSHRRAHGQGRQISQQAREAIEDHSMDCAKAYFRSLDYTVEDKSKGNPFDLLCTKGDEILYVEVKGTTTLGQEVLLTKNEVSFAESNGEQMVLFILHSIDLPPEKDGTVRATGGVTQVTQPWRIDRRCLTALTYAYRTIG